MKTATGYLKNYLKTIIDSISKSTDFSGTDILTAFPANREVYRESSPVIILKAEKLSFSAAAFSDYIGTIAPDDSHSFDGYGKHCDITLCFSLYSPTSLGGDGCYDLAAALCDFLSFAEVVFPKSIVCSDIVYNQQSKCYKMSVSAEVPSIIIYETQNEQIKNIVIRSVK